MFALLTQAGVFAPCPFPFYFIFITTAFPFFLSMPQPSLYRRLEGLFMRQRCFVDLYEESFCLRNITFIACCNSGAHEQFRCVEHKCEASFLSQYLICCNFHFALIRSKQLFSTLTLSLSTFVWCGMETFLLDCYLCRNQ